MVGIMTYITVSDDIHQLYGGEMSFKTRINVRGCHVESVIFCIIFVYQTFQDENSFNHNYFNHDASRSDSRAENRRSGIDKNRAKMKHTKGNWKINKLPNINQEGSISSNGIKIADITVPLNGKTNNKIVEESKANAKLIAAAPEMLAVLSDIIWTTEQRIARGIKLNQREINDLETMRLTVTKATLI